MFKAFLRRQRSFPKAMPNFNNVLRNNTTVLPSTQFSSAQHNNILRLLKWQRKVLLSSDNATDSMMLEYLHYAQMTSAKGAGDIFEHLGDTLSLQFNFELMTPAELALGQEGVIKFMGRCLPNAKLYESCTTHELMQCVTANHRSCFLELHVVLPQDWMRFIDTLASQNNVFILCSGLPHKITHSQEVLHVDSKT